MEWWTLLWLNEGFATWVSYLATDSLFPESKMWAKFLNEITGGLKLDGLEGSHPIEVEINHAAEVVEIFDAISYRKGGSVIRMLQNYLGAECFQLASFEKVNEVDEFFKSHPNPSMTRTLKQSIEQVQINAKRIQSVQSEKLLADVVTELAHRKY
ncbi:hypothetical protein L3X38_007617 [Prunus dulcis]|uniref:Peptidase M1 membrane alanine aminopeptidase domain-containing protein n=1 Tax=Prunus dulcis TaxID=3755 RepID=A0AAD5F654_PRUDU|nr:hypothetical protein L3X38_007617 [Prunus dulcis]